MTRPLRWKLTDLVNVPKAGVNVMSTFSCGGGSSMGYKLAGFDVIIANDIDPVMARHYQANLHPKHYLLCPIKDLLTSELPQEAFGIDILDGSPPCSTFSLAGKREKNWGVEKHFREGQAKQVLDDLFFDFLDVAERIKPKIIVAENVKGMISGNAKGYVRAVLKRLEELEYDAQLFLINGADCELPQRRERVFFVAIQKVFNAPKLMLNPKHPWISIKTALSAVENSDDDLAKAMCTGPMQIDYWMNTLAGKLFAHRAKIEAGDSRFFSHIKCNPNIPAPTLPATWQMLYHWDVCRCLTVPEMKVLSSFPDDWEAESKDLAGYMMGMSVPPYMTATVADAIREQWVPFIRQR